MNICEKGSVLVFRDHNINRMPLCSVWKMEGENLKGFSLSF